MILKHFYLQVVVRTGLILANTLAIAFVAVEYFDILILINLIALLVIQVWLLIRAVNITNNTLAGFFESLEMEDMMLVYRGKQQSASLNRINSSLSRICKQVKDARSAEAEKTLYLKAVTEHAGVGLIAVNSKGEVELFNRSAAEITGINYPSTIKEIEKKNPEIAKHIKNTRPTQKKVIKVNSGKHPLPLSLRTTEIKFRDNLIKLISIQNIRKEMEEKELESWQELIRVLTHEIMNSVGPLISSIDTISGLLTDEKNGGPKEAVDLTRDTISDTIKGMEIIKDKTIGLKEFVRNFRSLTELPQPDMEEFPVKELVEEIKFLVSDMLKSKSIVLGTAVYPDSLKVLTDRKNIIQVLINLINNSVESLEGRTGKKIEIKAFPGSNERTVIAISDNGSGIPYEIQNKIFIPFFTTKKNGSGIGLSLSRQIMMQQGGYITVESVPGEKTAFNLVF